MNIRNVLNVIFGVMLLLILVATSCKKQEDAKLEVTTYAGSPEWQYSQFGYPWGIAINSSGILYIADKSCHCIRKVDKAGLVSTLTGYSDSNGFGGYNDGSLGGARFDRLSGVAVDAAGNIYVGDTFNDCIRKIDQNGNVTTLAGSPGSGYKDGPGNEAKFYWPSQLATDASGNVYVADVGNHRIRKIDKNGNVTTLAGTGEPGFLDGPGSQAKFYQPYGVCVDSNGNIYVADYVNERIRRIDKNGIVSTVAGTGVPGLKNGPGNQAQFRRPLSVAVDKYLNVYVADRDNNCVRKIDSQGNVTTLAGTGEAGFYNSSRLNSKFNHPRGVAVDSEGNVYVADTENFCIRKISQE